MHNSVLLLVLLILTHLVAAPGTVHTDHHPGTGHTAGSVVDYRGTALIPENVQITWSASGVGLHLQVRINRGVC